MVRVHTLVLVFAALVATAPPADALERSVLDSVVRLKPDWPADRRSGAPRDPEGTGVAVFPGGYIATNVHVVGEAETVRVLAEDGRHWRASVVGLDRATDIALIRIDGDLPVLETAPPPDLAEPVCAIGNQFGLGLSVTCGVVSATGRAGTGFNAVEDFIQTDASVNPGGSGGALVDRDGRLVGLVSAIFTKRSDADIGVNFAASVSLLMRVVGDLKEYGRVRVGVSGFKTAPLPPSMAAEGDVMVASVDAEGPAFAAGLEAGDVIRRIGGRTVRDASSLEAALYMLRPGDTVEIDARRGDATRTVTFVLGGD